MHKKYSSKILLFGEYAILNGGEGLAIPYPDFNAEWIEHAENNTSLKPYLFQFADYLEQDSLLQKIIDTAAMKTALNAGLDIRSNIPIGYGAGSSGVVVAAVFERFAQSAFHRQDLLQLKNVLGRMEDYFHSKSSGVDPLVCYINKPLHILPDNEIRIIDTPIPLLDNLSLYDTGINRFTKMLVDIFQERMKDEEFKSEIFTRYLELNENCIAYLLKNEKDPFFKAVQTLSFFQLEYFNFAIPPVVREVWEHDLHNAKRSMKLCGAGGGGFMIRFSE